MDHDPDLQSGFVSQRSTFPERVELLKRLELCTVVMACSAMVVRHGLRPEHGNEHLELGAISLLGMGVLTGFLVARYRWSLASTSFMKRHLPYIAACVLWCVGVVGVLIVGPKIPDWTGQPLTRMGALVWLSEFLLAVYTLVGTVTLIQRAASAVQNPALLLAASFLLLITVGTLLLMLPRSRRQVDPEQTVAAPFSTALFTATSASCVTGLIVEPTGSYWSETGHAVILFLFQIGGLGIMTWGALFAVMAGRQMNIREAATFRELLDSESLRSVRHLLLTILGVTLGIELCGAILLSGLWSDLPLDERIRYSVFHSVSAFCNAGFSLHDEGFLNRGSAWQVWGPLSGLIIIGGLGFSVVFNLVLVARGWLVQRSRRILIAESTIPARVTLASRLALYTTGLLLLIGTVGFFLLESTSPNASQIPVLQRMADAWFQSVTFRTAGFNTVDHGALQTATKFFVLPFMFVGACPGSTGGGIKTVNLALLVLTVVSVIRGRPRVECHRRSIPVQQVSRSLMIIGVGMVILLTGSLLLVLFEEAPDQFINHLFEATSAFGTVGVSTGITGQLSRPSQMVIIVLMFVGRIGPLTLLMALSRSERVGHYEYPEERVALG